MKVEEIFENKGIVCNDILRSLPDWFGIEQSIQDYVKHVEDLPTFAAWLDGKIVGFLALKTHFSCTAEIYVMGVKKEFQNRGIGKALLKKAEEYLCQKSYKFLTVKTVSSSFEDVNYANTRSFYDAVGFYPLEEFKKFWDENNPCLFMVKVLY